MCAKKASTSPKSKPAASARKTAAAEKNGVARAAKTATRKATATKTSRSTGDARSLSNHDIGLVAGEIWGCLTTNNGQTLAAIKKSVAAPSDVVAAAIGWLAREDKLEFTTSGRTLKIGLRT
jgi:Winged helix-turn-helix domain (DUF2582)